MQTKNVTYLALNSSQRETGLPESTSMPPFPDFSDITTLSSTCCSLTRKSRSETRRKSLPNVSHSGVKKIFERRQ